MVLSITFKVMEPLVAPKHRQLLENGIAAADGILAISTLACGIVGVLGFLPLPLAAQWMFIGIGITESLALGLPFIAFLICEHTQWATKRLAALEKEIQSTYPKPNEQNNRITSRQTDESHWA